MSIEGSEYVEWQVMPIEPSYFIFAVSSGSRFFAVRVRFALCIRMVCFPVFIMLAFMSWVGWTRFNDDATGSGLYSAFTICNHWLSLRCSRRGFNVNIGLHEIANQSSRHEVHWALPSMSAHSCVWGSGACWFPLVSRFRLRLCMIIRSKFPIGWCIIRMTTRNEQATSIFKSDGGETSAVDFHLHEPFHAALLLSFFISLAYLPRSSLIFSSNALTRLMMDAERRSFRHSGQMHVRIERRHSRSDWSRTACRRRACSSCQSNSANLRWGFAFLLCLVLPTLDILHRGSLGFRESTS